jgi:glycerate dehydrogenase
MARIVVLDAFMFNPGDNPWTDVAALGDLQVFDRTAKADIMAHEQSAARR